jgi:hypothetical protein
MVWLFLKACVFGLGIFWCREMFKRLPRDLADLKASKESAGRSAILFYWVVTALLMLWMASFVIATFGRVL